MGAVALVLILRTRELTGSYAAGGLVAAANALGHGLLGPVLGRLVDRRGQTVVLVGAGAVHGAALVAFALLQQGAPLGAAVACAAVAGAAMPPTGPCLRAIWGTRIEVVYIAGPIVFVGLIGAASLPAAAASAGVVTAFGAWLFAAAPASRGWRPEGERASGRAGALRGPGVRVILLALFVLGIAIAAVEIGVAAFAGSEERAAVLLALWGAGSLIGGIVSTRRNAPADPPAQMAVLLGVMAVLTLPLALDVEFTVFGALMVLAGLAIAPSLATGFGLLGQVAPAGTVTEAYTWVATGMGGGIALGSALGGWIVESSGTTPAFVLAAVAVGTAGTIVFAGAGTLRAERRPHLVAATH
jgi:predicted MFS family arabinose efflux permease